MGVLLHPPISWAISGRSLTYRLSVLSWGWQGLFLQLNFVTLSCRSIILRLQTKTVWTLLAQGHKASVSQSWNSNLIIFVSQTQVESNNLFPCVFWYKNGIQWPPWPSSRGFQWGSGVTLSIKPPCKLSGLLWPPCWRASLCFCDGWSDPHCVRPHATVCSPIPLLPPPKHGLLGSNKHIWITHIPLT